MLKKSDDGYKDEIILSFCCNSKILFIFVV